MLTAARFDARPRFQRRPRRPKRVPRNPFRRVNAPRPPHAVELYFVQALKRIAADFARGCLAIIQPHIADFAKPEDERGDARLDASRSAKTLLKQMRTEADRRFKRSGFDVFAEKAGERAVKHSQNEFRRLGISVKKEPAMQWLLDGWRKDNVARIRGMQADQLDKVERLLEEGFGMRHETLAKEIERQLEDVTASRAELIARDQVLTLNAQITRHRQTAAGIEAYIWTTSNDERVREEHEALEGMRFSWDDPPEVGHPGEDINCRCVAFPVLPELEDTDEEDK